MRPRESTLDVVASESIYPHATVDGFTLGMFVSYDDCGDAWVEAPDGSFALIWETGDPPRFEVSIPAEPNGRWGTYDVQLPLPLTKDEEAAEYLRALLPDLIPQWRAWQSSRGCSSSSS